MNRQLISSLLIIALATACGGGGGTGNISAPATSTTPKSITYVDPVSGTYRLIKNNALSTPTHLVLDLTGFGAPTGTGMAFTFALNGLDRASWTKVATMDMDYLQNGPAFATGTSLVLKGKVTGPTLTAVLGLKGSATPQPLEGVLARIAVELQPGAIAGSPVLSAIKTQVLLADGTISPVVCSVGSLLVK